MCSDCWASDARHRERNVYREEDEYETPHKSKGKTKESKRYKGCPERNGKAHIYVWIEYFGKEWGYGRNDRGDLVPKRRDVHYYEKVCVGCEHRTNTYYDWGFTYRRDNWKGVPEAYEVRHVGYGIRW